MDKMIQQNTPEWLEMRKNKIGASDSAPIMGVSPYKTAYQLWEEKLDLVPVQKVHKGMQKGHDLEEPARLELEKMTGLFFLPQVKYHATIPYMMASLDAIDPESKTIAEIKCPNKEDHQVALAGQVPEKYMPQIQHQLEVCQLEMGYYFSFDGTAGVLLKIYRDDKFIKKLLEKELQFWECIQEFHPPEMTERDYEKKTDHSWACTASEWLAINSQLKLLEQREKALRDSLICMCDNKNSIGSGIKITKYPRKGAIEYANIPELKDVNLESYRKKTVQSYRITAQ